MHSDLNRLNKRLLSLSPEKSRPGLKPNNNKKILDDDLTKRPAVEEPLKKLEDNYSSKKKRTEQPRKDMYVDIAKRRVILPWE